MFKIGQEYSLDEIKKNQNNNETIVFLNKLTDKNGRILIIEDTNTDVLIKYEFIPMINKINNLITMSFKLLFINSESYISKLFKHNRLINRNILAKTYLK